MPRDFKRNAVQQRRVGGAGKAVATNHTKVDELIARKFWSDIQPELVEELGVTPPKTVDQESMKPLILLYKAAISSLAMESQTEENIKTRMKEIISTKVQELIPRALTVWEEIRPDLEKECGFKFSEITTIKETRQITNLFVSTISSLDKKHQTDENIKTKMKEKFLRIIERNQQVDKLEQVFGALNLGNDDMAVEPASHSRY